MNIQKLTPYPTLAEQTYESLKRNIVEAGLPGSKLPTEKELVEAFNVSRKTIRIAVDRLVAESLLRRVQGKGTFVGSLPIHETKIPITNKNIGILFYRGQRVLQEKTFYASIFNGFLEEATDAGYVPMLFATYKNKPKNDKFFEMCRQGYLTGAAVLSISYQDTIREVAETGLPCVVIDHWSEDRLADSVEPESINSAVDTVKELYKLGHRRIGYMAWSKYDLNPHRLDGYKAGLKSVGLPYDKTIVVESESGAPDIILAARKLLSLKKRPSAVICNDNSFSRCLIGEAKSMGISVPSELSVAGFEGLNEAGIASISVDTRKMGIKAFQRLKKRIENPNMPFERIFIPSKLKRNKTIAQGPCIKKVQGSTFTVQS